MIRVSKDMPCPICKKEDWCMVSPDGKAAICPRIPSDKIIGESGFLHILSKDYKPVKIKKKYQVPINWDALNTFYQKRCNDIVLQPLVEEFGYTNLKRMGIGYDGESWTFPMRNSEDEIIGVQRRFLNGDKRFVKGSKNGLFIPRGLNIAASEILICEGVSDTIAALDMDFEAIGRVSCGTGVQMLCDYFTYQVSSPKIIIVADNDLVGIQGAKKLAEALIAVNRIAHVIIPPVADLRAWKESGLTKEELTEKLDLALDNLNGI